MPGRPSNLDNNRTRSSVLAVGANVDSLDIFLLSIISYFSLSVGFLCLAAF